ncbi:MAG: TlpA family protein disulfide reductase [Agarilytica sp.]
MHVTQAKTGTSFLSDILQTLRQKPWALTPLCYACVLLMLSHASIAQHAKENPTTRLDSTEKWGSAANWIVATTLGSKLSLEEELAKGNKVIAIFWATWCGHCRELLPKLEKLKAANPDAKVTFVAMNIWEDSDPRKYAKNTGLSMPIVLNAENIAKKYGVKGTPGVFVVGQNNTILYQRSSGETPDAVITAVKQALNEAPSSL